MRLARLTLALLMFASVRRMAGQAIPSNAPYRDARLSPGARTRNLLDRMTLDEKFWQLFMIPGDLDDSTHDYSHGVFGLQIRGKLPVTDIARAHAVRINAIQRYFVERTRLGIPIIPFEEGVHGLGAENATVFPAAIALAATWDTALVRRVALAIARESKSRGIRQLLSPVVNIANDVRWGRVEETYGEDPYLASQIGLAFVDPIERAGVVTTPKHFVANIGDGGRDSYPVDIDERLLDEMYFPPFVTAVQQGHARSVMSAYNSVNGDPASQNHALLTDKLKRDWGFGGFVISDQAAVGGATVLHHTEASTASATADALDAGLDVIFQSSYEQYRPYLDAFHRGLISTAVIDSAVARVLRVKFELGLFEDPYANPDSAAYWNDNAAHRALARQAATESIVLLRNQSHTLPLGADVHSIAVIGVDAVEARTGGYSGTSIKKLSILDGIRERFGPRGSVAYAPGPGRDNRDSGVVPKEYLHSTVNGALVTGVQGEYFDNITLTGTPRIVRTDDRIDFGWTLNSPGRGIPFDWYSARWNGTLTAPAGGMKSLGVEGNDGYRLYVDGKLLIDDWKKQSYNTTLMTVDFAPATEHSIRLEYFESTGNARLKLIWAPQATAEWSKQIDSAVTIAKKSDAAIVVMGVEEGEFRDRAKLGLRGHQEELIRRVAAAGKPAVVVLVGGSAITMSSWLDSVSAVLDAWYPGEEGGGAVADVLFGEANPSGRLPITFPIFEGQLPLVYDHKPTGRGDDYVDLTGQPLFPFGFGMSYASFEYSNLIISPETIPAAGTATVRCRVKNTSPRAGDEIVQLYVHDNLASVARPVMQLEGFRRVHLAAGEEREVLFTVSRHELEMLDRDMHWIVEPGSFRIMVGASSKDIRLRGELTVK